MLVFREGRRLVPGPPLYRKFVSEIHRRTRSPSGEVLLGLLLQSGELECALADVSSPLSRRIERITDALADSLVCGAPVRVPSSLSGADSDIPRELTVSRPEGFAYYALHPLNYADAVDSIALRGAHAAVIGIRSIGTTLSAVVAAAARKRGVGARRMTVRPDGHPWDRKLRFVAEQRLWVEEQLRLGSQFLVVDEGPGLSGSSFLSVGEALVQQGVPLRDIVFICSTEPDLATLRTRDAAARWRKFRTCVVTPPSRIPPDAGECFDAGKWREAIDGEWPGSWIGLERVKYFGVRSIFKFEGLGAYSTAVLDRAQTLAAAGFSPAANPAGNGFVRYDWLQGRMPRHCAAPSLDRIAEYCAWRCEAFTSAEPTDLRTMISVNSVEAFAGQYEAQYEATQEDLPVERAVIPDGKMQPYEWLQTQSGLVKLDSVNHGDDHFYPGATDIAWDLAGTIIEWRLDWRQSEYLLTRYGKLSCDKAQKRIAPYLLAYALFRYGYCRLAAESMCGTDEEKRLARDAQIYRAAAQSSRRVSVAA